MNGPLTISSPREGDVLNRHDGLPHGGKLLLNVKGLAPAGVPVTVNGVPAARDAESFTAAVWLDSGPQTLEVSAGAQVERIGVVCDPRSRLRYRFSLDDNIEWLADLAADPDRYSSLFDHWFLAFWRRMHLEYRARIHANLYYQTVDQRFNLSRLPDKWRDEFEANSDWFHLSFHALQDQPDRIYKDATYDQIARDLDLVMGEIRRFAGESVLIRETTVHWGEAPLEACRALRDRGVDVLVGLFFRTDGVCTTKYYLDQDQADYLHTRDAWRDNREGLTFVECDAVVNTLALAEVIPHLERQAAGPHTGEMLELLIHEQYFRRELSYFQPDVQEKSEDAIRWVTEHGYAPCFWGEGLLGSPV